MMNVPILCLVCLALLGWVVVLKAEIDGLKKRIRQLQYKLEHRLNAVKGEVEITKGRRLSASELRKGL